MMKYLIIIFFLFSGFVVQSQQRFPSGFPTQANMGWNKWGYSMTDSGLIVANRDTNWLAKYSGTVVFKPSNKKFYWFDSTNLTWNLLNNTIDTTSLSNRINLKLNITDTTGKWWGVGNRWVDTVYRVNDSTVGYTINGGAQQTFEIKGGVSGGGGGSGTVTSVGLSLPSAFSVTPSTITTSGTFAVTGAGTTSQYIRGNGTLATTDTGMIPNFYLKVRGVLTGTSPITFNQTTGAIGINNANTSGTKGAASFTSAFSDNGSGLIDLAGLVSAGSCTGCNLNIDAKGRITGYTDGAGGATNNVNIGAGFRPVNAITQEMRTYFAGFGQQLDSVANANGLTWSADTARITGLPTYFYVDSLHNTIGTITADNGLTKTGSNIQLGGTLTQSTTISTTASYFLNVTGSNVGQSLKGTNTSTGTGVMGQSTSGSGVYGLSSSLNGVLGVSTSGTGLVGESTSGEALNVYVLPSSTNTLVTVGRMQRFSSGTAANGIGGSFDFYTQSSGGSAQRSNRIGSSWSNATTASRTSILEFYGVNSATEARKAALAGTGQWIWDGYPALTAQIDTTTYKPVAIDGSGNVVKMAGWAAAGGGGATLNNIGAGYRWAATPGGDIKTVFNSNTITWDSTSNSNALTANADTLLLATQFDLLSAQYIVGRNLRVISGSPDTLATKDTLISVTPAISDSSEYVATTAWVKSQGYGVGGGSGSAAGNTWDLQIKNTNGGFTTIPESYYNIDSVTKSLMIGNPAVVNDLIEIDTGNIDIKSGAYKIGDDIILSENGTTTRVNETAAQTALNLYAAGSSRISITSSLVTVTPILSVNTTYQVGGVSVVKDLGTDLGMGSVDAFWRKIHFYANGVEVGMIDTTRWGFNNTAPTAVVHITPKSTGQYGAGLKLDSAGLLTTAEKYAIENDGAHLYWTDNTGTRQLLNLGYKVYTALLTQSGTGDPTAIVLGTNGIGTIVWTRNSTGNYTGTLTGAFTANKTLLICQKGDGSGSFVNGLLSRGGNDTLILDVRDNTDTVTDNFTNMSIEIRVYP